MKSRKICSLPLKQELVRSQTKHGLIGRIPQQFGVNFATKLRNFEHVICIEKHVIKYRHFATRSLGLFSLWLKIYVAFFQAPLKSI